MGYTNFVPNPDGSSIDPGKNFFGWAKQQQDSINQGEPIDDFGTGSRIKMPAFQSITDANGNLLPQYALQGKGNVAMDPNIATNNPWAQMMLQQSKMQTGQQLDQAAAQGTAGTTNAWDQLAARGGLSSGARERVARLGANNAMATAQGIRNTGAQSQLGVLSNATDKQAALDTSNRAYNTGIDQVNLQSQLANKQEQEQYNMNKYNTQMGIWAANQQANATAHSGKKG